MKAITKFTRWFNYWLTPYGVISDFARDNPKEFMDICKALYIDKMVNWLSKKISNHG
jgi:hypothetical protein